MSDKWWDGLTPEGIQNTLNREIQIRDDRIEELEKENFTLAATQCPFPDGEGLTGSPSGHAYCAKDEELEGCDEYIQSLIKTIDEGDANTEYYIDSIAELEAKLEKLEAKLEKAVTALKFYRSAINLRIDCEITYAMQEAHDNAFATLAELKTQDDK